jgi:dolichol-phosphate mannosyltransferase
MHQKTVFSIVVPVYGCKTALLELYLRLKSTLEPISPDFEIIMVNDSSPDQAWDAVVEIAQKDVGSKAFIFTKFRATLCHNSRFGA